MNITRFNSIIVLCCMLFIAQRASAQCTFTSSVSVTQVSCFGGNNGVIDLTITGGTQPLQFVWSNGIQDEDLVDLAAGSYTVTVTDGLGCSETITQAVGEPSLLTVTVSGEDINCWFVHFSGLPIYQTELTANASGGTGTYFYIWSNSGSGETQIFNAAGTYTVTVVDGNSCLATAEKVVVADTFPIAADAGPDVNFDCQTPQLTLGGNGSASGPGISYAWTGPGITTGIGGNSTSQFPSVSVPGVYTLEVFNGVNFCSGQDVVVVGGFPPPIADAGPDTGIPCGGNQVTLDGSGSSSGVQFTYQWTTLNGNILAGANTLNPLVNQPGTYTLLVTDTQNGCTRTEEVRVFPGPVIPQADFSNLDVSCTGQLGIAAVDMTQGTGPYTYLWSNGSTQPAIINIFQGTYSVTVTDANNCDYYGVTEIKDTSTLTLSALSTMPTCIVGNDGAIDLTAIGLFGSFEYAWNTGETTQDLSNLSAGTYTVTVTYAGGSCTETLSVTLGPAYPVADAGPANVLVTCATAPRILGGPGTSTGPDFTYQWETVNGSFDAGVDPTQAFIEVTQFGTYTLTVTNIAEGCSVTSIPVSVVQDGSFPVFSAEIPPQLNCAFKQVFLKATASSTGPQYSYLWTTSNGHIVLGEKTLTPLVDKAGDYILSITNNQEGCTTKGLVTVMTDQNVLTANAGPDMGLPCGGGQVTLNGSASIGAQYAYLWSTTGGNFVSGVNTLNPVVNAPGMYKLSVFDTQNVCIREDVVLVFPGPIIPAQDHFVLDVSCTGQLGEAAVTMTQGTGPYTYLWSTGSTNSNVVNVLAGTYTVTVMDVTGCNYFGVLKVGEDHSNVSLTTVVTNYDCASGIGGTIDLTVTGMPGPIEYAWGIGETTQDLTDLVFPGTYHVTVSFASGTCSITTSAYVDQINTNIQLSTQVTNDDCGGACIGSVNLTVAGGTPPYQYIWGTGSTTKNVSNLCPGNYFLTVADATGCQETIVAFVEDQSANIVATAIATAATCGLNNGSIDLTVNGGTPQYTYNWTDGGTTQDRTGLSLGTYTVTVTDAMGCTKTANVTVGQTSGWLLSAVVTASTVCTGANGAIDLSVVPIGSYAYSWSNGATNQDPAGLPPGNYTVTVTDGASCSVVETYTVDDNPNLPMPSAIVTPTTCDLNNGSIDASVTGGVAPFVYLWTNSETTQDIFNIPSGNYILTVTGANGCTNTISVDVANNNLTFNIIEVIFANNACNGVPNGFINLGVTPLGTYSFNWSNGATTQSINGLISGTYVVTVSAGGSCTLTEGYFVPDLSNAPDISSSVSDATCNGSDGSIDLTISGGTPNYIFEWSNGSLTEDLAGIPAGNYTVTVSDAAGCAQMAAFTVAQSSDIALDTTVTNVLCFGGNTGAINLNATGANGPFTYLWSNAATTQNLTGIIAGTYTVTVTDANLCSKTITASVTQPTAINVTANINQVSCFGGNNGAIDLSTIGGTPVYTFVWSNAATTEDLTGLIAGTYTVTVTDSNGCTKTTSSTITQNTPFILTSDEEPVTCFGGNDGSIGLHVLFGGSPPFTYNWSNGATTKDLISVVAGTYTVTVTDSNNCTKTTIADITEPPSLAFNFVSLSIDCNTETITGPNLPNLTYQWTGPNGFTANTAAITTNFSGLYNLVITDLNGCTATNDYTVNLSGGGACGAIKGRVYHDEDESCSLNFGEPGVAGWIVRAEGANDTLYGVTNAQGQYLVGVPLGTYAMKVFVPNGLWTICPGGILASVNMLGDTVSGGDFPVRSTYICPALTVSIGTDKLRRCFADNYYQVEYCNQGTQKAEDAYITVVLDQFLTVVSATIPYIDQGSNSLHVEVGDLEIGECGSFSIQVIVNCNAVLGQTHCTQAFIYPDTLCAPTNSNWSGASLSLKSVCTNDSLQFILRNDGKATMSTTREYIVVEDGIMFRSGTLAPLAENDSMIITVPANGSTWRVEVDQEAFHPYASPVGISVEACVASASFSTGFVNQFPYNDEPPTVDVDCTTNIGSFDPNDKYGYPVGYGADHYIRPGTDIEYLIRFQNTGTDTAFRVEIIDTLSSWLDPSTIRFGASSHPYRYDLNGEGIVHFIFEDIFLPDSNTNEVASNGFAKFIIKPRLDAPLETIIENTAAIYFDFNDPIFTNTTFHRLGNNFVTVGLWQPEIPEAKVIAMPNPFHEQTMLEVKGLVRSTGLRLQVFDLQGNVVREMESENEFFQLKKGDWPSGIYLFKITQHGRLVGNGKLMAE